MQEASKRATAEEMAKKYHDLERDFIGVLERGTDEGAPGIIGRRAGKTLQRVPSVLYSGMLVQWGILEPGLTAREHFARIEENRRLDTNSPRAEDEGLPIERIPDGLDPGLPTRPEDFLRTSDFTLTPHEVTYLKEAITRTNAGTLLARLAHRRPSSWTSASETPPAPWVPDVLGLLDPVADRELRATLDLAERFSLMTQGASLLYNLLLAEATAGDTDRFRDDRVEHYRERLEEWAGEAAVARPFDARDLLDLGQLMTVRRRKFTDRTRSFLDPHATPMALDRLGWRTREDGAVDRWMVRDLPAATVLRNITPVQDRRAARGDWSDAARALAREALAQE